MDVVLADPRMTAAADRLGASLVRRAAEQAVSDCRAGRVPPSGVVERALSALPSSATTMRRVINAIGVIVHTNLGRAPLSPAAVAAMATASGTTDVELDLVALAVATHARGREVVVARGELVEIGDGITKTVERAGT
jgi:L-seryl-tRNA(Ser) seleniumtransferase